MTPSVMSLNYIHRYKRSKSRYYRYHISLSRDFRPVNRLVHIVDSQQDIQDLCDLTPFIDIFTDYKGIERIIETLQGKGRRNILYTGT